MIFFKIYDENGPTGQVIHSTNVLKAKFFKDKTGNQKGFVEVAKTINFEHYFDFDLHIAPTPI